MWMVGDLHLGYPQDPSGALCYYLDYLGTTISSAAYPGILGRLVKLHARQVDSYWRLGRTGFFMAFAEAALALVDQATSGIFPQNGTVGWLFSGPGFGFVVEILLTSLGLCPRAPPRCGQGVLRCCGFGLIALVFLPSGRTVVS